MRHSDLCRPIVLTVIVAVSACLAPSASLAEQVGLIGDCSSAMASEPENICSITTEDGQRVPSYTLLSIPFGGIDQATGAPYCPYDSFGQPSPRIFANQLLVTGSCTFHGTVNALVPADDSAPKLTCTPAATSTEATSLLDGTPVPISADVYREAADAVCSLLESSPLKATSFTSLFLAHASGSGLESIEYLSRGLGFSQAINRWFAGDGSSFVAQDQGEVLVSTAPKSAWIEVTFNTFTPDGLEAAKAQGKALAAQLAELVRIDDERRVRIEQAMRQVQTGLVKQPPPLDDSDLRMRRELLEPANPGDVGSYTTAWGTIDLGGYIRDDNNNWVATVGSDLFLRRPDGKPLVYLPNLLSDPISVFLDGLPYDPDSMHHYKWDHDHHWQPKEYRGQLPQ